MSESDLVSASTTEKTPSAAKAWIAVALSPIGVLLAIGVAYAIAAMIGVTLDPATPTQTRSFAQNTLCWGIATLVALSAPIAAVVLALPPARAGTRSGKAALVAGILVLLGVLALMIPSLISW
jgi:hypothetical protein